VRKELPSSFTREVEGGAGEVITEQPLKEEESQPALPIIDMINLINQSIVNKNLQSPVFKSSSKK
jgi:hypothetical protein